LGRVLCSRGPICAALPSTPYQDFFGGHYWGLENEAVCKFTSTTVHGQEIARAVLAALKICQAQLADMCEHVGDR
jgi:hypothetical protein